MARSQGQDGAATAVANNTADDWASAGNDTIHAGNGANQVAGEAMAVNTAGDATTYANNDAYYDSSAGDDSIVAGDDGAVISGGSQARATAGDAKADTDNRADRKSTRLNSRQ